MGKGKIAVTNNFSFSHIVFKRLGLQACKNQGLFGKGLKAFTDNKSRVSGIIDCVCKSLFIKENIAGKAEDAVYHPFFLYLNVFKNIFARNHQKSALHGKGQSHLYM